MHRSDLSLYFPVSLIPLPLLLIFFRCPAYYRYVRRLFPICRRFAQELYQVHYCVIPVPLFEPEAGTRRGCKNNNEYAVTALDWTLHLPGVLTVYSLYIYHDKAKSEAEEEAPPRQASSAKLQASGSCVVRNRATRHALATVASSPYHTSKTVGYQTQTFKW